MRPLLRQRYSCRDGLHQQTAYHKLAIQDTAITTMDAVHPHFSVLLRNRLHRIPPVYQPTTTRSTPSPYASRARRLVLPMRGPCNSPRWDRFVSVPFIFSPVPRG